MNRPTTSLLTCLLASTLAGGLFAQSPTAEARPESSSDRNEGNGPLSHSDWAGIHRALEAHRHEIILDSNGDHRARQVSQRFTIIFDGRGFSIDPQDAEWEWGLDLARYGFEGSEIAVDESIEVSVSETTMTYRHDDAIDEWFRNDLSGFEHGFTVRERPSHGAESNPGELSFWLDVRGGFSPNVQQGSRTVGFEDEQGVRVLNYCGLIAFDATGRALPARFECVEPGIRIVIDESQAKYPLTIDPFVQQAYLKASTPDRDDLFGASVAVSGDTAVVGALSEESNASGVNGDESDNSLSGSGAAYVFVRSGGIWTQQAYLKASNPQFGAYFGDAVSISGDTVVIGAPGVTTGIGGESQSGAAYVFVRTGTTWSQQGYLVQQNPGTNEQFGGNVSISGDTIVIGAPNEDSAATGIDGNELDDTAPESGAAYVFSRTGTTWSQEAYLKASNTEAGDRFGDSVAISGDTVVVGASRESSSATGINGNQSDNGASSSGAGYVFVRTGSVWSQQAYLKASDTASNDRLGFSAGISGDTAILGAAFQGSNDRGAAYVFERVGTTWSQSANLLASNADTDDRFGWSVAVSGDELVVGAIQEDSDATGINGNGLVDSFNHIYSGAAYFFGRAGSSWSQRAYVKASNTGREDRFGYSVSVDSGTYLIGALREDSSSPGVNGDQTNNSERDSGAAYVFEFDGGGCSAAETPTLNAPASATNSFGIDCPTMTQTCLNTPVILFGECSPITLPVPPPIGCGTCGLIVSPSWGTLPDGVVIGPGLQPGFSFCVQCGCISTGACIDLSKGYEVLVGP